MSNKRRGGCNKVKRQARRERAAVRQAAWDALTNDEKRERLNQRLQKKSADG